MTHHHPPNPDNNLTIAFEVRPRCSKCERLATVFDRNEVPYCARHGTIFMIVGDDRRRTRHDAE